MHHELLEVHAEDSNYAIIKPPGRSYPGCVIQGDSLASLSRLAKSIAIKVRDRRFDHEDLPYEVEDLLEQLLGRLMHYQHVLQERGIDLPYVWPFKESDFIKLTKPSEDEG